MIIITGTLAYDYIMDFPGKFADHILPSQIHQLSISFNLDNFEKRRGGTAGNVSYSLGLLHTPHMLFSVVGKGFSDYKKKFKKLGIDLHHVHMDTTKKISTGFAMTDRDNNQIWGFYYGAAENITKLDITTVATPSDLVLAGPSGAEGTMHIVKQCISTHIPYMFDPGMVLSKITSEDLTLGVAHATYIIGNDYEIALMQQRVANWQSYFSGKTIITTLGDKGARVTQGNHVYTIPVVQNRGVVDPTGAGDGWRAGFLAGMQRNFTMQICGQMGAVAASYVVEKYGTQQHNFRLESFQDRYFRAFATPIQL